MTNRVQKMSHRGIKLYSHFAFTLAEMMVVMLVMSIVMAASTPLMTRKATNTNIHCLWKLTDNNTHIYYGANNDTQGVIIGSTTKPATAGKLYINTQTVGTKPHIAFYNNGTYKGRLMFTDQNAIVLGTDDVGETGNVDGAIAIGNGANFNCKGAIAIGKDAFSYGWPVNGGYGSGVALGDTAKAYGGYSVALGAYSQSGPSSGSTQCNTAVGSYAKATANDTTALGYNSNANAGDNTALGYNAQAITNSQATAIGCNSIANGNHAVALGSRARSSAWTSIGIGYHDDGYGASASEAIAIGYNSKASGEKSTAVGRAAQATTSYAAAYGYDAQATTNTHSTSIGSVSRATGYVSTAVGHDAQATNSGSVAVGWTSRGTGAYSTAVGRYARATNSWSISIGAHENTTSYGATGLRAISIGVDSLASGQDGVAIGPWAKAAHTNSVALGISSSTTGNNQIMLGRDADRVYSGPSSPLANCPIGTIIMWPSNTWPQNISGQGKVGTWLYCNGSAFNTSSYPVLYNVLGSENVPDMRGLFVRGVGGNSGGLRAVQGDAIRNISGAGSWSHADFDYRGGGSWGAMYAETRYGHTDGSTGHDTCVRSVFNASRQVPTSNENRPINMALHFFIKAAH